MSQSNFTVSSYICTVEYQPILWKEDSDLSVSGFGGYLVSGTAAAPQS